MLRSGVRLSGPGPREPAVDDPSGVGRLHDELAWIPGYSYYSKLSQPTVIANSQVSYMVDSSLATDRPPTDKKLAVCLN